MTKALMIKDFPGYYITDTGEVYSRKIHKNISGRIRKLISWQEKNGYRYISLHTNGVHYNRLIHRLVAQAFIPNPEYKPEVNHLDGNKSNNRVENLEWATRAENERHKCRVLKTWRGPPSRRPWQWKAVLQIKDGTVIKRFESVLDAARTLGTDKTNIATCCRGKQKTAAGYEWKYESKA